jgi:hypothetical protein
MPAGTATASPAANDIPPSIYAEYPTIPPSIDNHYFHTRPVPITNICTTLTFSDPHKPTYTLTTHTFSNQPSRSHLPNDHAHPRATSHSLAIPNQTLLPSSPGSDPMPPLKPDSPDSEDESDDDNDDPPPLFPNDDPDSDTEDPNHHHPPLRPQQLILNHGAPAATSGPQKKISLIEPRPL